MLLLHLSIAAILAAMHLAYIIVLIALATPMAIPTVAIPRTIEFGEAAVISNPPAYRDNYAVEGAVVGGVLGLALGIAYASVELGRRRTAGEKAALIALSSAAVAISGAVAGSKIPRR